MNRRWAFGWLVLLVAALAYEAAALLDPGDGDTLSEVVKGAGAPLPGAGRRRRGRCSRVGGLALADRAALEGAAEGVAQGSPQHTDRSDDMSTEGRRGTRSQFAGSNSTQGGVARRGKDQLKNPAMNGARVAHWGRTLLWVVLVLMVAPAAHTPPGASAAVVAVQRGEIRSGPRNVRLAMVRQEVDSILWSARWVQPQITGGGADPDTYEVEVYTGFVEIMEGDPNRIIDVDGGTREAEFWTAYECPDTFYVHVRVRGHGQWRQGDVTPWSDVATGSFVQDCPLPDMPPPPEVTVDTVRTDTTDLDLAVLDLRCAVQPVGYLASLGGPDLPADPEVSVQADLRTMSGTGAEWGSRQTLLSDGQPVAEVDLQHGGWTDSARYVRLGSGFTLPEFDLAPGPDYAVRFEIDAHGQVVEPDEGNNTMTVACPEVS